MDEYIPPEEMAEIIKDQLAGRCIDCEDKVSWEGTPEDIKLDPYDPDDFKKMMRFVGEVHIKGGLEEVEEYIKQLGTAYGNGPLTITTDAREVAKDWLQKKYDSYNHDHDHDHDDGKEVDNSPMIIVDAQNNFRCRCTKTKVDVLLQELSKTEQIHGWRAVTYEEFEELNKSI